MAWKNLLSAKSATATSILSYLLTRQKVFDAIKGREIEKCPFMNLPEKKGPHRMDREKMATVRWLRLRIVAEIAFNERTNAGHPRHSKFFACGIVQMYAQKRGQTRNKATTL
jgi:ATP-dependent DNA ligase